MEHAVELDELKSAWRALDTRLQRNAQLNATLYRESRTGKARRGLRPLVVGQIAQIVFGALLVLMFAPYWVAHRDSPHLLACGLALHVAGLIYVVFAARNLVLIQRLDYAAPVLEIQKRLAALRAWRVRVESPVFAVVGSFVWIPLVLVELESLARLDLWRIAPGLVLWTFSFGAVGALGFYALWRWSRKRWARTWDDHAAGSSVRRAEAALEELRSFERD